MELTNKNYFSKEAMNEYWSASQFKSFMKCEAAAMAELNGEYEPETTTALLVGSYVDAYFSGELEEFKAEHPEILKRDGTLKADFARAEEMIRRCEADPLFMQYLTGMPQVIKTGELFGYPWKIKIDAYHPGHAIVDLKTTKDLNDVWVEGEGKLHWIEAWGYDIQGAVYQAIEGDNLPFFIAAVTKETEPDIELYHITRPVLDNALSVVRNKIDHFADVKAGLEKPTRCGKCAYCKQTKRLKAPIEYGEYGEY